MHRREIARVYRDRTWLRRAGNLDITNAVGKPTKSHLPRVTSVGGAALCSFALALQLVFALLASDS